MTPNYAYQMEEILNIYMRLAGPACWNKTEINTERSEIETNKRGTENLRGHLYDQTRAVSQKNWTKKTKVIQDLWWKKDTMRKSKIGMQNELLLKQISILNPSAVSLSSLAYSVAKNTNKQSWSQIIQNGWIWIQNNNWAKLGTYSN